IGVYDQAGDLFEDYDSHKMFNNNDSIPEIYTFAGKDEVAINGLAPFGNSKQMALGFNTRIPGTFTIKALELLNLEEGTKVLLRDNVQGINQDLTVAPEYTFTSDVAATADRFTLTIQKAATELEKTVQTSFGVRSLNGGQLEISLDGAAKASVKVFDTIGRLVFAQDMNGQVSTLSKSFNNGVYLVKVSVNGLVSTKKVAINL
ncbi:MAG: T9SS type A sorting domain-containing protein, partial [Bacteroidia bacterium]|nr:T9SS type A sorting domain-containing protein [Bacteroidia bacterium]